MGEFCEKHRNCSTLRCHAIGLPNELYVRSDCAQPAEYGNGGGSMPDDVLKYADGVHCVRKPILCYGCRYWQRAWKRYCRRSIRPSMHDDEWVAEGAAASADPSQSPETTKVRKRDSARS